MRCCRLLLQAVFVLISCLTKYPGLNLVLQVGGERPFLEAVGPHQAGWVAA